MRAFWADLKEKFARRQSEGRLNEQSYLLLMAAIIGLGGGLGAIGFRHVIHLFGRGFLAIASLLNQLATGEWVGYAILWDVPFWAKVLIPALGGLIVGPLIYFFAAETKGHGVPEVMVAVALKRGVIRMRVVFAKMFISALTIASGGSAGREGPIVQIGSAVGSSIGQLLKVSPSRLKIFVGCGAAAGIGATFNAPVAGMFFAMEVILGDFAVGTLSAVAISSVVGTVVARMFVGDELALMLPQVFELVSVWEVITYAGLGLCAALAAMLFIQVLAFSEGFWERRRLPEWLKPAMGMMLVGVIGIWFPPVFGVGYEAIDLVFAGKLAMGVMALLVLLKLVATSLTLGAGASGGVFAPSLGIGAFLGGAYGTMIHHLFPTVTAPAGAYAL
ncbi:MAG: chloride channel protein, partial [Alphaproteobacteria bacterium]